jgi:hypothetical protein
VISISGGLEGRKQLWRSLGARGGEVEELLLYGLDPFTFHDLPTRYPLGDEPFVAVWEGYQEQARREGVLPTLRQHLPQLRFPIVAGISEDEIYRAATRRGELADLWLPDDGLALAHPEGLRLFLHGTPAGRIPVLLAEAREDFVALVQALTRRNEPWPVPTSMGACIVSGYNNWSRIFALRRRWEDTPPETRRPAEWSARLSEIAAEPSLYQDRFILLSVGPYSGVEAAALGLEEEPWRSRSHVIRLEHETAHYFTRQVLGSMRNALSDELIADYVGLVSAEGRYRGDWFLRFLGLERFPRLRPSGRLASYRGEPPLSREAFLVLQRAVERATRNLERIDERRRMRGVPWSQVEKAHTIIALARLGLEGLASGETVCLNQQGGSGPAGHADRGSAGLRR